MEYTVYVKTDANGHITAVNSSEFLTDTSGWTEIDRGRGDKYHHAQRNFLPLPILTDGGVYRYKLADGAAVECTEAELTEQGRDHPQIPELSHADRIEKLELQNEMLLQCVLEMSEVIYA